jgi:hypothetical protein
MTKVTRVCRAPRNPRGASASRLPVSRQPRAPRCWKVRAPPLRLRGPLGPVPTPCGSLKFGDRFWAVSAVSMGPGLHS